MAPANLTALPIFTLGTVLFAEGLLPLRVFETRYVDMVCQALKSGEPFGVCAIREGKEVGAPALPAAIGTLAYIEDCDMEQLGVLQIKARGEARFRILAQRTNEQGLVIARAELLAGETDGPIDARYRPLVRLLESIIADHKTTFFRAPYRVESAQWVSSRIAEILPIPAAMKQRFLEMDSAVERLESVYALLEERGLFKK